MQFGVNHWGSHPNEGNDDLWSGDDFATYEEAFKAFWSEPKDTSVAYIELVKYVGKDNFGTILVEPLMVRNNPSFLPEHDDDSWRREQAMEAGMLYGIEAYNERMGYL